MFWNRGIGRLRPAFPPQATEKGNVLEHHDRLHGAHEKKSQEMDDYKNQRYKGSTVPAFLTVYVSYIGAAPGCSWAWILLKIESLSYHD